MALEIIISRDGVTDIIALATGKGALCPFSELFEEELTIPVLITQTPLTSVAEGTGILLNKLKLLEENQ